MPTFSDDNARVTVKQLNDVVQGMAEKNEGRYRKQDASGGVGLVVSATKPSSLSIWVKPVT